MAAVFETNESLGMECAASLCHSEPANQHSWLDCRVWLQSNWLGLCETLARAIASTEATHAIAKLLAGSESMQHVASELYPMNGSHGAIWPLSHDMDGSDI